ncbi:MAG TPA: tetratricopeptide repeat protein [Alphaproteobacteria bacterium]|jgi:predicted O-linked N-acetylglucosamine transferase (SPINDLY family)|nr:tetratricopeptide repeat protein [Alphaproteobacteria bacterium]
MTSDPFSAALGHHQAGRLDAAAAAYEAIIAALPGHTDALYNLALLRAAAGDNAAAEGLLRRLLALLPDDGATRQALARVLTVAGDYGGAIELFAALDVGDDAELLHQLGSLCRLAGRGAEAVGYLRRAAALTAEAEVADSLALALFDTGALAEAEAAVARALESDPGLASAHNTRGLLAARAGRPEEALASYRSALELDADFLDASANLGEALRRAGRRQEALALLEPAAARQAHAGLLTVLGTVQHELRHNGAAIASLEAALERQPGNLAARANLAATLQDEGRPEEAEQHFLRALEDHPEEAELHLNYGKLLQAQGRHGAAVAAFDRALGRRPEHTGVHGHLVHSLLQTANWSNLAGAMARVREICELALAGPGPVPTSPFALVTLGAPLELIGRATRRQVAALEVDGPAFVPHQPGAKLHLGYLSPDFKVHSVATAFEAILAAHDRQRFRISGYSLMAGGDEMTARLAAGFDDFVPLDGLSQQGAAQRIKADGVDVLIDLAGLTQGARPEILALRPAPVQVHMLGYMHTLGGLVDYLVADPIAVPEDERRHYAEHIIRLPHTWMPAARRASTPASGRAGAGRAAAGLPEGAFVFANLGALYKIEPEIFDLWMRLLRRVPGSVLWLLAEPRQAVANLRRETAGRGVDPRRLVFAELIDEPAHLGRLALADLGLDTWYHPGGVSTADALWAGLPVVLAGPPAIEHPTRVSLVAAAGLPELVAGSFDDYFAKALAWAQDGPGLAALKARLAANRASAPLFDAAGFCRHLEQGLTAAFDAWRAGRPPADIDVDA